MRKSEVTTWRWMTWKCPLGAAARCLTVRALGTSPRAGPKKYLGAGMELLPGLSGRNWAMVCGRLTPLVRP